MQQNYNVEDFKFQTLGKVQNTTKVRDLPFFFCLFMCFTLFYQSWKQHKLNVISAKINNFKIKCKLDHKPYRARLKRAFFIILTILNGQNDQKQPIPKMMNSTVHFYSKLFETVQSIFILYIFIPNNLKQCSPIFIPNVL